MPRDRSRPWKRPTTTTQVGLATAPVPLGDEISQPIPTPPLPDDDDRVTHRVRAREETIRVPTLQPHPHAHALMLDACLAQVRAAPADRDARDALRALATDTEGREHLARRLAAEADAMVDPAVAAALHEERAELLEDLDLTSDAIAAMERVVALAPDEAAHHDRLARLYHRARAWVKAAESFEQVAALTGFRDGGAARARAALRGAARLYGEHGRPERALEMYRLLVARHPGDLEAWRGLDETLEALGRWRELAELRAERAAHAEDAALRAAQLRARARALEQLGDHAAVARVYEEACELAPDDAELAAERDQARAALLVARAAGEARAGDAASAERRLRAALAARPAEVQALLALADVLDGSGRTEDAAEELYVALETRPDPFPRDGRARVVHRYARLVAALGAPDDAHELLHEAHRLDRRNLVITLALGDSCFARRLWRESSILLGGLAEHPDARHHAAAVAAALVRAAQADVRGLRPAGAEARLAAAVELDPGCAPAWQALADRAAERGDLAEAERCWTQIVDSAPAATLEKLLVLQRRRGAGLPRARTCERLAALAGTVATRKELLEEAADAYLAAGELPRARAIAAALIAAHPHDLDAVACAGAVAVAAGDDDAVVAWLAPALAAWDERGRARGEDNPRHAELWRRLGDARRALGDAAGAQHAYDRAVAAAPDADGAQAARRGLVALAAAAGRSAADSLAGLVAAEHAPGDVLALARARAAGAGGDPGDARPLFELARALGAALAPADEAHLAAHPARALAPDQAYGGPLGEPERRALVDDDDDAPAAELLGLLADVAALLCPAAPAALVDAGLVDAERVSATSPLAAAAVYPQIAKALGGPATLLYFTTWRRAADTAVLLAAPPVIVLGPGIAAAPDAALRFRLGRAVELARFHRLIAAGDPGGFARFLDGLRRAVADGELGPGADPAVGREARRLRAAIPLLLRKRVAEHLAALGARVDPAAYVAACERAADRSGLLACGDAEVALRLAGGPRAAPHLVHLAASPRYLAARRTLWRARR